MRVSVIVPAYNAAAHIGRALDSIHAGFGTPAGWSLEVIVVDDGSRDAADLARVLQGYPDVKLVTHPQNCGMCAARNSGIQASTGDFVTLLDSDDEYLSNWFGGFLKILEEWPAEAQVCYTPCLDDDGRPTCSTPGYRGWLTPADILRERYSGEYNPIFRGDYIRAHGGYVDIGLRKSCGVLTYLRLAREHPFWISDRPQRIYHAGTTGSVTVGWTAPHKAAETYACFSRVLAENDEFIRVNTPEIHGRMRLKLAIYRMLAGNGRSFGECLRLLFSGAVGRQALAALVLLAAGPRMAGRLLTLAKEKGWLRQYG